MRGSLSAPKGKQAEGKRLVWENGVEQPLWSPNSEAFWNYLQKFIVEYAKLSRNFPALIGVFLDFENYAPGRPANCYSLSYDKETLELFGKWKGIKLPRIPPSERKSYLERNGFHKEFSSFQKSLWIRKASQLRQAVDNYNPSFVFCVYPAPGTPFMREALYRGWATKKAPLLLADAVTYGRPSRFTPQKEALLRNRKRLLERKDIPEKAGVNHLYLGGIDPAVRGADPEFCGRNALMISEVCNGYWVFYEGVSYKGRHREYFRWFSWANEAIREGRYKDAFGKRETPEPYLEDLFRKIKDFPSEAIFADGSYLRRYEPLRLRGENVIFLKTFASRDLKLRLRNVPVGKYHDPLGYELRYRSGKLAVRGMINFNEVGTIRIRPEKPDVLVLALSAGRCAYVVEESSVPFCVGTPPRGLSIIHGAKKLFFLAPEHAKRLSVRIETRGSETAKLVLFDPEGKEAGSCETTPQKESARLSLEPLEIPGIWSLAVVRAAEGVLEDVKIKLSGVPPYFFLRKEDIRE